MRRRAFLALMALFLAAPEILVAQTEDVVVYLVRHAEQVADGTNDPPLSEAGQERAALLNAMLADAGLTHIHTTDYNRTRQTGAPMAAATGLDLLSYDPRDLPGLAHTLRATPGRHLVLGHSNTTPDMVSALGGDPGEPIDEREFDRLYIVTVRDGLATTVLLHYGAPFGG